MSKTGIVSMVSPSINYFQLGIVKIQYNLNGSKTDGSFTMAVSNSSLSPLKTIQ